MTVSVADKEGAGGCYRQPLYISILAPPPEYIWELVLQNTHK